MRFADSIKEGTSTPRPLEALRVLVVWVSLVTAVYVAINSSEPGYEQLWLMPLTFGLCFAVGLYGVCLRRNTFGLVFTSVALFRYVALPAMIVFSALYGGRSSMPPSAESYQTAILLSCYELVALTVATVFFDLRRRRRSVSLPRSSVVSELGSLKSGRVIFVLFGLAVLGLLVAFPSSFSIINFVRPSVASGDFFSGLSFGASLGAYGAVVLKQLIFVAIALWCCKWNMRTGQSRYLWIAVFAALMNTSIYIGTNRSDIVISAVASMLLISALFGERARAHLVIMAGVAVFIVSLVTEARAFYRDPSITDAQHVADYLQTYLGGPYNVAIALEMKDMFPEAAHWKVLLFDIFRPMIGVNVFVRDLDLEYSNIYFNERMFVDADRSSQILPMIGQGNLYLGLILAPLIGILFVWLAHVLMGQIARRSGAYLHYFLGLAVIRLGFMQGQNSMNMVNDISMNLFLFLLVWGLARLWEKDPLQNRRPR